MKHIRSTPALLAEIEQVLASNYSAGARLLPSPQVQHAAWGPLTAALALLRAGRRYARVELELKLHEKCAAVITLSRDVPDLAQSTEGSPTSAEYVAPVRIGGHDFGEVRVASGRERAFGPEERVLLKQVARRLAAFLGGKGHYILTRARLRAPRTKSAGSGALPTVTPAERASARGTAGESSR